MKTLKNLFLATLPAIVACHAGMAQPVKQPVKGGAPAALSLEPEQDCMNALSICDNLYFQPNSYSGEGQLANEINPLISCLSAGERNDVWYSIRVVTGGMLNFTITPVNPTDDYDWAVYNLTSAACSDIALNSALEVRCNFSANVGCGGQTGANGNTSGICGQQNTPPIPVMAGERYVINVSNFSATQSGYTIDFTSSTATIFDNQPPVATSVTMGCTGDQVTFPLSERLDCNSFTNPVSELLLIDGNGSTLPVQSISVACGQGGSQASVQVTLAGPVAETGKLYLVPVHGTDGNTFADDCGNYVAANDTLATVDVQNDLQISLGGNMAICPGDPAPLLDPQTTGIHGWTYNGIPAGAGTTLQTGQPGLYAVTVAIGTGCTASDTMELTLLPAPQVSLGADTTVCNGGALPLLHAGTGQSFAWSLNGTPLQGNGPSWQAQQPGTYTVTVTGTYCHATDTVSIRAFPAIDLQLEAHEVSVCSGEHITIIHPEPGYLYTWKTDPPEGSDQPMVFHTANPPFLKAGMFYLTVTDSNGCTATDSVRVSFMQRPAVPVVACPAFEGGQWIYRWEKVNGAEWYEVSNDGGQTWTFPSSGMAGYSHAGTGEAILVRARSEGHCDAGPAAESAPCEALLPSAISPNGDGRNDFFRIISPGFPHGNRLSIFNRYGQRVFHDPDYRDDWDARGLPRGTYFYHLQLPDGSRRHGYLSVIR